MLLNPDLLSAIMALSPPGSLLDVLGLVVHATLRSASGVAFLGSADATDFAKAAVVQGDALPGDWNAHVDVLTFHYKLESLGLTVKMIKMDFALVASGVVCAVSLVELVSTHDA